MFLDEFSVKYDNMMNPQMKSDFMYSKFSHMKKTDIETIIRMFNNAVGTVEKQNQKDFSEFNLKEVVDLFERNEWQHANTFAHNKSLLKQYVDWCRSQNKISGDVHPIDRISPEYIVGTIKFDRQYFKSFDDFRDCIEEVYNNTDVDDISRYIPSKSMLCLSWLRFSKEEIRFLKKEDVDVENRSIISKLSGFKVENINDYILNLLKDCIDLIGYNSHNGLFERYQKYQENDYLIRTVQRSNIIEIDPVPELYFNNSTSAFRRITRSYSPTSKYFEKGITCESLYQNGIYFKMYEVEKENKKLQYDFKTLSEISRFDIDNMIGCSQLYNNYEKWRKYFYGN